MQKIIISGCNGHMGRVVAGICATDPQVEVVAAPLAAVVSVTLGLLTRPVVP